MTAAATTDIHFTALCNAIEHEKLEKAKAILETHPGLALDNANNDGFTPLDLAFMTGNAEILRLLIHHRNDEEDKGAAIEGSRFTNPEAISHHLSSLINQSKDQVEKFGQLIKSTTIVGSQLTPAHLKECEKQRNLWQKRLNGLKKLKQGLETSGRPHAPAKVIVEVTGPRRIRVKLQEPEMVGPHSLFTKFRVQWSKFDSFNVIQGEQVVFCSSAQGRALECIIDHLEDAERYFVRASFGNLKGFGSFSASTPKSVIPSSWRSVQGKPLRINNQLAVCQQLMHQLNHQDMDLQDQLHHDHFPEASDSSTGVSKLLQILTLGAAASGSIPKFHRHVQANKVYLTLVLFHEDRVLMTNEEILPLVYVDENNIKVKNELHWLAKLSYNWTEVPKLKAAHNKVQEGNHFRTKLLQVIYTLQSYLSGLHGDLGQVYHAPFTFQDSNSVVFSLIQNVRNFKSVVSLSLKWVPLAKVLRNQSNHLSEHSRELSLLRRSIRAQILFHQVSSIGLNRGLYLCYVQAKSSLEDGMQVIVSNTSPSILPYVKIRDNPHVTSDEWRWVIQLGAKYKLANKVLTNKAYYAPSPTTNFLSGEGEEGSEVVNNHLRPTEEQYAFGKLIQLAMERLFDSLQITHRAEHRIYEAEIIELSEDVNVILVLPPASKLVQMTSENSPDHCLQLRDRNDLIAIGLNSFEVLHLGTYFPQLLAHYVKVANAIEADSSYIRQLQKETLDPHEADEAASKLAVLANQQQILDDSWKPVRWLFDILSRFRNRGGASGGSGITFANLCEFYTKQTDLPDDSSVFAQPAPPAARSSSVTTVNAPMASPNDETVFMVSLKTSVISSFTESYFQGKHHSKRSVIINLSRSPTTRSDPSELSNESVVGQQNADHSYASTSSANRDEPNILQVYAAYDTGLASGTSVKLTVTKDTTAREVIDLVIKQLNMAVILKGRDGPVYENDKLKNFCLVAVIGSRERCLRDDFRPLNLQNPWRSGKLFVRMKNDVLAALERINSSSKLRADSTVSMSASTPNMMSASASSSSTSTSRQTATTTVL